MASHGPSSQAQLAIDRLPDGEVSPYLVDDIMPGDRLEVKGPIGGYFVWRPTQAEPIQLIAGGSGVVPLMAMVRAHRDIGSTAELRQLYSVRTPAYAYFADELAELPNISLEWVYTIAAPDGWDGKVGRIDADVIVGRVIGAEHAPGVYVCGSTGFVERAASLLVQVGHDPTRVRTQRYGGAEPIDRPVVTGSTPPGNSFIKGNNCPLRTPVPRYVQCGIKIVGTGKRCHRTRVACRSLR